MTGIPGGYDYSTPPPPSAKRLEAGWAQRIAWTLPIWGTLGLFAAAPFLYAALRRGLPSDWTACISYAVYEAAVWTWLVALDDGTGDGPFGLVLIISMIMGTTLTLFALFDPKPRRTPIPFTPARPQPNPYQQQGYPYGR